MRGKLLESKNIKDSKWEKLLTIVSALEIGLLPVTHRVPWGPRFVTGATELATAPETESTEGSDSPSLGGTGLRDPHSSE